VEWEVEEDSLIIPHDTMMITKEIIERYTKGRKSWEK